MADGAEQPQHQEDHQHQAENAACATIAPSAIPKTAAAQKQHQKDDDQNCGHDVLADCVLRVILQAPECSLGGCDCRKTMFICPRECWRDPQWERSPQRGVIHLRHAGREISAADYIAIIIWPLTGMTTGPTILMNPRTVGRERMVRAPENRPWPIRG